MVGAAGDVGQAVCSELSLRHEIVAAGRNSGDVHVNLVDEASVHDLFKKVGSVDAVVSATGDVTFAPLADLSGEQVFESLRQKALGQINLALIGAKYISDGGSFTLTSGILDREPVLQGTCAATANGALAGFVKSAAQELPRGLRLNVVSPGLLDVSAKAYGDLFPGHKPVSSELVGLAYAKCVEGGLTGQVVTVD